MDKRALIKTYLNSKIGAPIVDACDIELDAIETSFVLACTRYWTAFPYQTMYSFYSGINSAEIKHKIQDITDTAFSDIPEIKDSVYFLGVGRYDMSNNSSYYNTSSTHFDRHLLGRNAGWSNTNMPMQDPRYLADRTLLANTNEDFLFGELEFRHDTLRNEIIFTVPYVEGYVTLWYNWGLSCEKTLDVLPMVHFEVFKKMVAFEFLDTVVAARSQLSIGSAEAQFDVSELASKRDIIKEDLDRDITNMSISPAMWS